MFKLDLEKVEEPEMKLLTSVGSQKKQENFRKTSTSASSTTLKPLTLLKSSYVWITFFFFSQYSCMDVRVGLQKNEHWRIDAFELWCWRKLWRVFRTAVRSNQSILKEISPEYSLEELMLKLKLQYFGNLMRRTDSLEKTLTWERLKAGGEGGNRGWDGWMASLTQWTWVWLNSRNWWWTMRPGMLQSTGSQRVRRDWAAELNWTQCHRPWSQPSTAWLFLVSLAPAPKGSCYRLEDRVVCP